MESEKIGGYIGSGFAVAASTACFDYSKQENKSESVLNQKKSLSDKILEIRIVL